MRLFKKPLDSYSRSRYVERGQVCERVMFHRKRCWYEGGGERERERDLNLRRLLEIGGFKYD
jgi:hypothetical protein